MSKLTGKEYAAMCKVLYRIEARGVEI
jgi:hypothetical protein